MRKKFSLTFFHLILIVLIAGFAGFFIGTNKISAAWRGYTPIVSVVGKTPPNGESLNMSLFYQVLDRVNQDYYDKSKINSTKILYGAISGALSSLDDPYTAFFPPKQNTDFKTQLAGQFSGIGAELGTTADGKVSVTAPLDSSPAQKAGIRAGDIILAVNGESTAGWTLPQAVDKIRGPKGSTVELTILHDKEKSPVTLKIVRDTIVVKSVTSWVKRISCANGACKENQNCTDCTEIAYIRLSQFGDKTNDEWTKAVSDIYSKMQNDKNIKGIVLDLRNNPGGYLQDAVFMSSEFIESGVVVSQVDGTGAKTDLNVSRKGLLLDTPLVVLINKGSASASEIMAGALRDHNRAQLIGEISFGKGTIQQPLDLDGGASVHISVGKWITPNGTWVNKKGLAPDITVKYDEKKTVNGLDNQLQAAIQELVK